MKRLHYLRSKYLINRVTSVMIDLGYEKVFVDRFLNDLIILSDIINGNTSNEIQ
jgi:hypothetical protein